MARHKKTPLMLGIALAALILIFNYIYVSAAPPSISGYVTRFNGAPIGGATATLYNATNGAIIGTNTTGSSGHYLIDFLDGGDFYLVFNTTSSYLYGTGTSRNYTVSIASGENAIQNTSFYLKNFGSYNITVRDAWNSRPIPYANITVYYRNIPYQYVNKIADANGNALIEISANSTSNGGNIHDIYVEKDGYTSGWTYSQSVYEGTNKDLVINITGSCLIHGHISDSGANLLTPYIGNASIELWDNTSTAIASWSGIYNYTARSDSGGQYRINYPGTLPGTYNCDAYLHVSATGYITDNLIQVRSSALKDINLTGTASVTGRIMDISNSSQPISGATIRIMYAGETIYTATTDSTGRFNKSVRDGINHTLAISAAGYTPYQNTTVYNTGIGYGTIYLTGTGTLNITVMDETNTTISLEDVTAHITAADGTTYTALTDDTGNIDIPVRDDTIYTIAYSKTGYFNHSNTTTVSDTTTVGPVYLRGRNRVHGYVTDPVNLYNQEIENARIYLISNTDDKRYTAYSGYNGNYSFYADSSIGDYTVLFDKEGYNITYIHSTDIIDAGIDAELIGATHIQGRVYDIYSPVTPGIAGATIDIKDPDGNIHYSTTTDNTGNYTFDLGVNFIYSMDIRKSGYQNQQHTAMTWDQDRTGDGGADRTEDIYMNGTTRIHVTVIDNFDNMTIDNAQICVLFASHSTEECFYTKLTGQDGQSTFNIKGDENYNLKATRTNYFENAIYPLDGSKYSGNFTGTIRLNAYAWFYIYDEYAVNNEEIYDAQIEIYTYNNQTSYGYYLNETRVDITAYCNDHQEDGIELTLNSTAASYDDTQVTTSGNPEISFRTVPLGTYTLTIDGESVGCGIYTTTLTISESGRTYELDYTTDNIPPQIWNITEQYDPTEYSNNLTISADIVDITSSVSYVYLEFGPTNSSSNHTMSNTEGNTYSYTWIPTTLGTLNYTIWTGDTRGNINQTSGTVTIQDTVSPVVTITTENNQRYETDTVTMTYIPSDASGFTTCQLWTDTTGTWSLNTTNSSEIENRVVNSITITGIPDGTFTSNIRCTDRGGNSAFAPANIQFTIDAQAPSLTAISPINKSYNIDYLYFNVTSNKPLRYANLSIIGYNLTMSNSSLTDYYLFGGLWDGIYSIIYYGMGYNNHLGATPPLVFKIDTVAPDTTGTYPANSASFVETAMINFSVDADELVNMTLTYRNSSRTWAVSDTTFGTTATANSVPLFTGSYTWNYTLCDESGNCDTSSSHTFSVYKDTTGPTPSSISSSESTITQTDTVTLRAYWTDTESGLSAAVLETNENGAWANKTVYGSPLTINGGGAWSNFTWHNSSVPGGTTVSWHIWAKDTKDNYAVTPTQTFTVTPAMQLTVYVRDESNNLVQPDYTGTGAEVTLSNATYTSTKNTSSLGYVLFENLGNGATYDIDVDAISQGYGTNSTTNIQVTGTQTSTIITGTTRLTVNVTDASFAPVSGATVTVYTSDDTTVATDADNSDLTGTSAASGLVVFDRALPCTGCNVTVSKAGPIINSTDADIIAGNTDNYAWIDPPRSISNTFNLNFTLTSDILPTGVTINIKEYNSTVIIASNTTDSNGNAVIYGVPSGIYDFELDGESVGYDKVTYRRNIVGVHTMNTGRTGTNGRVKINVNGLLTYYVSVNASGFISYDDYYDGAPRQGTYDDSQNSTAIKPSIDIPMHGNTTLTGHVYDRHFKGPVNLSYEPVSNSTIRIYTQTSCTTPSSSLLRYEIRSSGNGTYTIPMTPMIKDAPDTQSEYCMDITSAGFNNLKLNDIDITNNINPGMTGAGSVTGRVLDLESMQPINSTVTLISKECYGGANPVTSCTAYQSETNPDGTYSFSVNTRGSGYAVEYMPYTLRFDSIGHSIRTGDTVTTLPYDNSFYLVPAPTSALRLQVTSEYGEYMSDNVEITITGTSETITEDGCILQGNEYLCILESGQYDIQVNSTEQGYGNAHIENHAISGDTPLGISLNITKAVITLIDENSNPVDNATVTLTGPATYSNTTTASGTATIHKVLPGTYDITFDSLEEYYGIINGTITISQPGETQAATYYVNITSYYINISNSTSGIPDITVTINGLEGTTNATGEIYYSHVNSTYTNLSQSPVQFNRTGLYEKGYIAPTVTSTIYPGLDPASGNNLTITLNRTTGFGIFAVTADTDNVNITLWYNQTEYITSEITSYDSMAFIRTNASIYNESLYITAQKQYYENYTAGPFNTSEGNISYISIHMVSLYGTCSEGVITSDCYCAGSLYSTGYCCSSSYSTSSCTPASTGSTSGGGGGSSGGSSSGGGAISIGDTDNSAGNETYSMSITAGNDATVDISSGYPACTYMQVHISNTGNTALKGLIMLVSTGTDSISTEYNNYLQDLDAQRDTYERIKICLTDNSIPVGEYRVTVTITSRDITKNTNGLIKVTDTTASTRASSLMERYDNLKDTLDSVDPAILSEELLGYYNYAKENLNEALDFISDGQYDEAEESLDEAENSINTLISKIGTTTGISSMYIAGGSIILLILAIAAYIFYTKYYAKKEESALRPILTLPSISIPKIGESALKIPEIRIPHKAYQLLGLHDIYYSRELSKKRFMTEVIEKVLELKCPKCGGRIYQNRCVWCGHIAGSLKNTHNTSTPTYSHTGNKSNTIKHSTPTHEQGQPVNLHYSPSDAFYTRKNTRNNGTEYITKAIEHVAENKCPRCGGKIYNGRCIWCGN